MFSVQSVLYPSWVYARLVVYREASCQYTTSFELLTSLTETGDTELLEHNGLVSLLSG